MSGINDNDARATVKAWMQTIIREAGVNAVSHSEIGGFEDLLESFRSGRIHAATTPADEYFAFDKLTPTQFLYFPVSNGTPFEEYVLLTQTGSGLNNLTDLKGRKLALLTTHRMSLAEMWLSVVLAQSNQPPADTFFGSVRRETKTANVVLPVFFKTADACLITRSSFNLMAEMNPQVGKTCRQILCSSKIIPNVVFFSRQPTPFGDDIRKGLLELHRSTAGKQMLSTFQLDQLVRANDADMEATRELVNSYGRLCNPAALTVQSTTMEKPKGSRP